MTLTAKQKLTPKQVQCLAIMAGKAYKQAGEAMGYERADEFRRDIVAHEVGAAGLSEAAAWHFVPLYNKFAAFLGYPLKPQNGIAGQAVGYWHKLICEALERYELPESYAVKIGLDKLGWSSPVPLDSLCIDLGAARCKQLLFTINNRGRAMMRKSEAQHGLPPSPEPHSAESMPPARLAEHFNCVEGGLHEV